MEILAMKLMPVLSVGIAKAFGDVMLGPEHSASKIHR
jgi:hypothetical protein